MKNLKKFKLFYIIVVAVGVILIGDAFHFFNFDDVDIRDKTLAFFHKGLPCWLKPPPPPWQCGVGATVCNCDECCAVCLDECGNCLGGEPPPPPPAPTCNECGSCADSRYRWCTGGPYGSGECVDFTCDCRPELCEGGGGGGGGGGFPSPSVDLLGPATVEVPNPVILSWNSSNTDSCSASNAWSGGKPTSGSETIALGRGTYTFALNCSGPGGSASGSVIVNIIQAPQCTFWADPANIIIPQVSNLRWTCQYADSCSINQGVGFVCATETECSADLTPVRPKQTTVYDLTCSGLDGSRFYDTTVNVGFTPRLKEILPNLNFLNIEFLKT